jgi:hypothetical protein
MPTSVENIKSSLPMLAFFLIDFSLPQAARLSAKPSVTILYRKQYQLNFPLHRHRLYFVYRKWLKTGCFLVF